MTTRTLTIAPRFLDVDEEPLRGESIVEGFAEQPIETLEEAIAHIQSIENDYDDMIQVAKSKACYSGDDLTKDEAAAIFLYTMKHLHANQDISLQLNQSLRHGVQTDIKGWTPYLQLLVSGLNKLPQKQGRVWRCAHGDISDRYQHGCIWLGFSSCTETKWVAEDFVDKYKSHTLFVIDCVSGKAIRNYSDHTWEDEVLLMPGACLRVVNKESQPNGIKVVYLQEESWYTHPFTWPISYASSINKTYQSEYRIPTEVTEPKYQDPVPRIQDIEAPAPAPYRVVREFTVNNSERRDPRENLVYRSSIERSHNHANNENAEQHTQNYLNSKYWLNYYYYRHDQRAAMNLIDLEGRLEDPSQPVDARVLERVRGSMFGMAIGDALGAQAEFQPRHYFGDHAANEFEEGITWGLRSGQFTDDTSMGLCLAASLIVRCDFVPYDQLVRYKWWFRSGYMSATGNCFDVGRATYESLIDFERRQKLFAAKYQIGEDQLDRLAETNYLTKFDISCGKAGATGNGGLLRLAPVPLFFYLYPVDAVEFSGVSGVLTHGSSKVYDTCRYFGALIVAALRGESKEELLDDNFYANHQAWFNNKPLCPEVLRVAHGSYKRSAGYHDNAHTHGYIISDLEAALSAFYHDEHSFENGVLSAVKRGDATDTTATIYGQLAGAYYGFNRIPNRWTRQIFARNVISCLSKWMVHEGERWKPNLSSRSYSHVLVVTGDAPNPQQLANSVRKQTFEEQEPRHAFQVPSYSTPKLVSSAQQTSPERSQISSAQDGYDRMRESSGNARPIRDHRSTNANERDSDEPTKHDDKTSKGFRPIHSSSTDLTNKNHRKFPEYDQQERYQELRDGVFYKLPNYIRRYPSDPLLSP